MQVKSRHHLRSDEVREIEDALADRLAVDQHDVELRILQLDEFVRVGVEVDGQAVPERVLGLAHLRASEVVA